VVEPLDRRVAAQHDQVSLAAAGLGLRGHLPGRLDGLQALDLPQRGLNCVCLVVGDDLADQAGPDVPVVDRGVPASLGELGIGGRHE
jgi:hypothetical protein